MHFFFARALKGWVQFWWFDVHRVLKKDSKAIFQKELPFAGKE